MHAGDLVHHGSHALQVLHVHRGDHVDVVVEQLEDVFVALVMLAAVDVGMRQFIHQRHLRMPRQDGIHVHLLEEGALVVELLARHGFQREASSCVPLRPWVSMTPMTTSSPRLSRRMASLSMA